MDLPTAYPEEYPAPKDRSEHATKILIFGDSNAASATGRRASDNLEPQFAFSAVDSFMQGSLDGNQIDKLADLTFGKNINR